jgi:hypothetical protein
MEDLLILGRMHGFIYPRGLLRLWKRRLKNAVAPTVFTYPGRLLHFFTTEIFPEWNRTRLKSSLGSVETFGYFSLHTP